MYKINSYAEKALWMDIETVHGYKTLKAAPLAIQNAWISKHNRLVSSMPDMDGDPNQSYKQKAALFPEFGKIVCVSLGFPYKGSMKIQSCCGDNESQVIRETMDIIEKISEFWSFAGHNVREFDIPYFNKRCIVNRIDVPARLNFYGKKPWEIKNILDTLDVWKMGGFKGGGSLDAIAACLGLPSPKENMDGSMVSKVYYDIKDKERLNKIKYYCEGDVLTCCNVFQVVTGRKTFEFLPTL